MDPGIRGTSRNPEGGRELRTNPPSLHFPFMSFDKKSLAKALAVASVALPFVGLALSAPSASAASLSASGVVTETQDEIDRTNDGIRNQGSNALTVFFNHWQAVLSVIGAFMVIGLLASMAHRR